MRKTVIIVVFMLGFPYVCLAQDNPGSTKPQEKVEWQPGWRVELFGGYSLVRDTDNKSGFAASINLRLAQSWSLRTDAFSVGYPSYLVVLGGPEYRFYPGGSERRLSVEPFFNTRAGVVRSTTNGMGHQSSAAWSIGVGGDIRVLKNVFLRPVEVNYIRANMYKNNQGGQIYANHLQVATGLGMRF